MADKISPTLEIEDLASIICDHLKSAGISAVLTGGSVVSIYSKNEYISYDLDFVTSSSIKEIEACLIALGYERTRGRHFIHPQSDFYLDFPSPPLMIGQELIRSFSTKKGNLGTLHLLSPTECVMDRLAAFYHWNDLQCLDQALAVAKNHRIDFERVRIWSEAEGMTEKFQIFREKTRSKSAPGC